MAALRTKPLCKSVMSAHERDLGTLHEVLTNVHLRVSKRLLALLSSDNEEDVQLGLAQCSPALLTAIGNFLKQNEITCQPEELTDVAASLQELRNKAKKGSARLVDISLVQ